MAVTTVYNIEQVVDILKPLGLSRTSIYRAINLRELKAVKVGRRYIVSEKALNEFLEGNKYEN